jgi:hypothetical protein
MADESVHRGVCLAVAVATLDLLVGLVKEIVLPLKRRIG